MTMRSSRIIDRLTGRGGVERDGETICEVDYEIIVSQPTPKSEAVPGTPNARGRLRVLEGKRNLMEGDLSLQLADGRQWGFTVTNGNPVSALYMVVQAGSESLAPGTDQP
jgi:hypothetical protein